MEKRHFVFLCHNSKDKVEVDEIRKRLQQRLQQDQIKLWLDKYDLEPLKHWEEQIEKLISHAFCAPIFVGSSGLGPYQKKEVEKLIGIGRNNPNFRLGLVILPSCLDDPREDPGISEDIKKLQWINFHQERPDPIEQLIWVITGQKPNQSSYIELELDKNPPRQQDIENYKNLKSNKKLRIELYKQAEIKRRRELEQICKEIEEEEVRVKLLEAKLTQIQNYLREQLERCQREFLDRLSIRESSLMEGALWQVKSKFVELSDTRSTFHNKKIETAAQRILEIIKQAVEDQNESFYTLFIDELEISVSKYPPVIEACKEMLMYYEKHIHSTDERIAARVRLSIETMRVKIG